MNDSKDKLNSLVCFTSSLKEPETFKEIDFIEGTNGLYFISDKGRVLSLYRNEPHILKPFVCGNSGDNKGYLYVSICGKDRKINRLVALAFIPNLDNKPIVDHIDEDKHNNDVSNLQWLTHSVNTQKHFQKVKQEQ